MKRCAVVRILSPILERNVPKSSVRTACCPSYVLDHFVVPVTVQRKSSAMLATKGSELPFDSSSKIWCTSCLFSVAPICCAPCDASFSWPSVSHCQNHLNRNSDLDSLTTHHSFAFVAF